MKNKIIPYNPILKVYARQLRKNSTLAEVLLWQKIKKKALGVQFHRQVPLLEYIVDFYCHELQLAIEIDGNSHEYKYENDVKRQGKLEKVGVQFLRFSDNDIKKNMFSVGLTLEETIREILVLTPSVSTPLKPTQGNNHFAETAQINQASRMNSFSKQEKLKSKKVIEKLFIEGKSVSSYPIKLIYLQTELAPDVGIKAGVTVPKKTFKSAVDRNRIKRLLREGYRLNKRTINNSTSSFAFLFLYLGKKMPDYTTIDTHIKLALQKFKKKTNHE